MNVLERLIKDLDSALNGYQGFEFHYDSEYNSIYTTQNGRPAPEGDDVSISFEDGYYFWNVTGDSLTFFDYEEVLDHAKYWFS
jgi:hypothetical protein